MGSDALTQIVSHNIQTTMRKPRHSRFILEQ